MPPGLSDSICCRALSTWFLVIPQVANSFAYYGSLASDSVLVLLKPLIEEKVGKRLHPTYSYLRIYYKDADLKRHTDRPSCEYSATLCIQCSPHESVGGETDKIQTIKKCVRPSAKATC